MGVCFIIIIIIMIFTALIQYSVDNTLYKSILLKIMMFSISVVFCIFLPIGRWISYNTYIDLVHEKVTINQRAEAIKLYQQEAIDVFLKNNSVELTDIKYANYQESIASMCNDLKVHIVTYNGLLATKRKMADNLIWNWFIVKPTNDMVPIDIKDLFNNIK